MKSYESSAVIDASPEAVWEVLTDGAAYPNWDSGVERVEGTIEAGQTIKVFSEVNKGRAFPVKVDDVRPARHMRWSGGMPLGLLKGVRTFTLTPTESGGTAIQVREEYTGPLLPLMWRSMPDLGPSFTQFTTGLKHRVEGTTPEPATAGPATAAETTLDLTDTAATEAATAPAATPEATAPEAAEAAVTEAPAAAEAATVTEVEATSAEVAKAEEPAATTGPADQATDTAADDAVDAATPADAAPAEAVEAPAAEVVEAAGDEVPATGKAGKAKGKKAAAEKAEA